MSVRSLIDVGYTVDLSTAEFYEIPGVPLPQDTPTVSPTQFPTSSPTEFPTVANTDSPTFFPTTLTPTAAPTEKIDMGGDVDPTDPDELTSLQEFFLKNRDILIVAGIAVIAVILLATLVVTVVRGRRRRTRRRYAQAPPDTKPGVGLVNPDISFGNGGPSL